MERNPWKLATIGMALVGTTALGTGLTTAYVLRSPATADAQETVTAPRTATELRMAAIRPAVATRAVTPAVTTTPVATAATPPVTPVSTTVPAPAECATGGDRAMRIAKPGVVGALLGAGLGAAGGAIADGGKGAGKGAAIGGIVGAGAGSLYGLNENRKSDEKYRAAYSSCMRARGYSS
jgi:hypothetical protein